MRKLVGVAMVLFGCGAATSALAQSKDSKPAVEDWIGAKMTSIALSCLGADNVKSLLKKGTVIPSSLTDWPTFKQNKVTSGIISEGSAGYFMSQVVDVSSGKPVIVGSSLSGISYPPLAVAEKGYAVTHAQNCMTMLAGKGNLKLSAAILQAALDATYDGRNTQALVLNGGTMTSPYAWALDDGSRAKFPGIERTEIMLDLWAWHRSNPAYAANDKLRFYGNISAIEAYLVKDISVESLLKGSASATGGIPFISGGAEGNGSAKVLTTSQVAGYETAVFTKEYGTMPTASVLAVRLTPRLRLVMDPGNQLWFAGAPVKLNASIIPAPQSACQDTWEIESGALNSVSWDEKTHACRFDATFTPTASKADTVTISFSLKSRVGKEGAVTIRVAQDVILSNQAAMISFSWVQHSLGPLPQAGSSALTPLTLSYRVAERQDRILDSVAAHDPLKFKCGTDAEILIPIKDAHVAPGAGTKDVMVSVDVPASALVNIASTPVRCTASGTIAVKSSGKGASLSEEKALPDYSFDLSRPAPPEQLPKL